MFIYERPKEECHAKEEMLHTCTVDVKKVFNKVTRKMFEWVTRKKGIVESLARPVMSE